jgi:membrane protease YdiL (CAAX protease family)
MNQSTLSVLCLITGFLILHFVPQQGKIKQYFLIENKSDEDNVRFIIFQRLLGIFFFGLVPVCLIILTSNSSSITGLNISKPLFSLISGFSVGILLILINYFNRKSPVNLAMYPQIRKREWTCPLVWLSALSWMVYLFAYEFLFRGFMLFSMHDEMGEWNAIIFNLAFYTLVHVPKGWKEAIGSIPLGFVLCLLCLHAGNIWPAFIAHCCLALSNEWFAIAVNPSFTIIKARRKSV